MENITFKVNGISHTLASARELAAEAMGAVGNSTWDVMNARKKVSVQWEAIATTREKVSAWGQNKEEIVPFGLESTEVHLKQMQAMQGKPGKILRKENILSNLDIKGDKLEMKLARMSGGFGRRAYGHYIIEAGQISKKVKAPVKLIYTREDDMTSGVYRPMYIVTYKSALDAKNNVTAIAIKGGGIPKGAVHENRFPAGAFEYYLAEGWEIPGSFRAHRSNFIASAEESFLDKLAKTKGKDPIEFRIELLKKAKAKPVGKNNEYDADRYIAVLELVKEKSGWAKKNNKNARRGVAAYFCHNSYAAHVVDMTMKDVQPAVGQVISALDCRLVMNLESAKNMIEGV